MAWRDELHPASFRGVGFGVDTTELQSGRRVVTHEYAQRDVPYGEDLGRQARRFSVEGYVLGADYLAAKNKLLAACEALGPGELIHPYYGARQVLCGEVRVREAINEGGMARFSLTFSEAGQRQFPRAVSDVVVAVEVSADGVLDALEVAFGETFSVLRQPQFVLDQAVASLQASAVQMQTLGNALINPVADIFQGLTDYQRALGNLVSTPDRLAGRFRQTLGALTQGLMRKENRRPQSVNALLALANSAVDDDPAPLITPSRVQAKNNTRALNQLVQGMALVEAMRLASGVPFDSYDGAIEVREQLLSAAEQLALTLDDEAFLRVQALRRDVSQAVPAPDQVLPRLVEYVPLHTLPALVIAYEVYGDATREAEIVNRNAQRIVHPGFIGAGESLEILTGEILTEEILINV